MFVSLTRHSRPLGGLLALLALPAALLAAGLPVDTKPPKLYRQHLEAALTPTETILGLPVDGAAEGDSGLVLLDERLVAVDEQGRRTTALHFAYKTLTDAGIKTNSEDVYRFNRHDQKAYLVLAETIQPDGTRQPVQPNAVLLQTPQRQAEYSLYDDQTELKIIFPNVRAGSITHGIIVLEDLTTKIPGELCHNFTWGGSWAVERMHYEINLPKAVDARLRVESLGGNIPAGTSPPAAPGRIRHLWALNHVRGERYEPGRPPSDQTGPCIRLTTISDWANIVTWYRGLLRGRDELKPALARLVDEWCKNLATPADVIAALHARVSDDVRYVGLEFGAADFQPHDCNEVWTLRYGDCKDKANLLAAMLRHRGIDAAIALVNTEHLGLVDRRTPGYHVFNHAIVAIPQAGGYLFCDPTIMFSTPGMIGTRTADRDVFVIARDKAEWAHTPEATEGSLRYAFDLRLNEVGELSGWLTLTAAGYTGAAERRRYSRLDPQEMRNTLSDVVRNFYPGAEVADTERIPGSRDGPYTVRAFFTVPGAARDADQKHTLAFPMDRDLLPDLGTTAERHSTYFLDRGLVRIEATFALPAGFQVSAPPPAFSVDAGSARMSAGWSPGAGTQHAELELELKTAAVRRDEFGVLYQARQALLAWLDHPLLMEAGAGGGAPAPAAAAIDFPLMPTGDGQINLADTRYPYNGDPAARRLALERTIQYFPSDPNTVFRASGRLAILDWDAGRNAVAHDRLAGLLAAYAGKVTADYYAWARQVDGLILRDLGRDAEALAQLRAISGDTQLSASRRSSAAPATAALLAKSDPAAAIALLKEIAALPEGDTPAVESQLALILLQSGQGKALATRLQQLVQNRPDAAEAELANILRSAKSWPAATGPEAPASQLATIVAGLIPRPGETLKQLLAEAQTGLALQRVKAALLAYLAQPALAEWNTPSALRSAEDYDKVIKEADDKSDGAKGFRAALQAASQLEADEDFPHRLWRAANYADWTERQGTVPLQAAVTEGLLDLCDQLPSGSEYFVEGKLLRATRVRRTRDYAREAAILEEVHQLPNLAEQYGLAVTRRLAAARESQGNYDEAQRLYATVADLAPRYQTAAEALLRMVFLRLHLGRDADAIRGIEQLQTVPAETLKKMTGGDQVRELAQLVKSGQAEAVWRHGRSWWPQWRTFATPHLGATDTVGGVVPVVANLTDLGVSLGEAKRDRDTKAFFESLDVALGAARWLPSYGTEIASLYSTTVSVVPSQAAAFRRVVLAILEGPHPLDIGNAAATRVQLVIHYIDGELPAKALPVTREFIAHPPAGGAAMVPGMTRLQGLAALAAKTDQAEAAWALADLLADPTSADQRAAGVRILADLYRQLGRKSDERELLKREVANPVIIADATGAKDLQARLEQLTGEQEFGQAVARWRDAVTLPWYDFVEPASLADPRLRDLNAVLDQPDKYFVAAEKVKLCLLVAQESPLPLAQRQAAVRTAANVLLVSAPTWTRFNQVAASVVDNPAFDQETRVSTLWLTLVYSNAVSRFDVYQRWRRHPLYDSLNETFKKNVAVLDEWAAHDAYSAESMLELAAAQADVELTNFRGTLLHKILAALANLGDVDAAEKFVALVPTLKPAPDFTGTLQARQLEYARQVRMIRYQEKVHDRVEEMVRRRFPALADRLPEAYADLCFDDSLPVCSRADTNQACLYLIKAHRYLRKNFEIWGRLVRSLPRTAENEAFACELMAAAMAAAETDALKSAVLDTFLSSLDLDQPAVATAVRKIMATVTDQQLYPDTILQTRAVEVQIARRTGTLTDVDSYFAGLTSPSVSLIKQSINLSIYAQQKDVPALSRLVDGMSAELLLSPRYLRETLPALELLGRKEETEAARAATRTELRRLISQSWLYQNGELVPRIARLAGLLHEPALVPPAWAEQLGQALTEPMKRLEVALVAASVRDDWKSIARITTELNRDYPTFYHFYWNRATAELQLHHETEARKALEVYVQYAKDEKEYPEALALLQKLPAGK